MFKPDTTSPHDPAFTRAGRRLPTGFMFGAATSAHQVEGECTNNDWWAWEQAGRVAEPSGIACDHYRRFREDFDLAQLLGHDSHRLSLEWSRIEPEEGRFSESALRHYREVLEALRARGLEPVVTLYHFTLPRWLAEQGGWENPRIEQLFARYVAVIAGAYGDIVRWWITINEPTAYVLKSYLIGEWPPGRSDFPAAIAVLRRMMRAHAFAYRILHAGQPAAMVSVAHHGLALRACDPGRWEDRLSLQVRARLCNHLFIDGLHHGHVRLPGLMWERLPETRTLDFLGLNYYTRDFVQNSGFNLPGLLGRSCACGHDSQVVTRNALGWEIYPEGLGELAREFQSLGLPILITENGVCAADDDDRAAFDSAHVEQIVRAMAQGVPIVGYLYWSLLDNFEWAHGFGPRFGLVEVDYATQERRIRPSAWMLSALMGRIPPCRVA